MDERLIQQQEQELAKTGRYYLHVCFMTIPLLCMACFLYGLRPLLLCGAALLTGNLCDRLVSLLRRRVYRAGDFSNESFALIIALLMPATVDWYVVIMAVLPSSFWPVGFSSGCKRMSVWALLSALWSPVPSSPSSSPVRWG